MQILFLKVFWSLKVCNEIEGINTSVGFVPLSWSAQRYSHSASCRAAVVWAEFVKAVGGERFAGKTSLRESRSCGSRESV